MVMSGRMGAMMTENRLKILTLNIWGIAYTPHQKLRARSIAAHLAESDYTLVALQEVWLPADRELLARTMPYAYYYASQRVGSGLLTLSRYPIIETQFLQFQMRGRADRAWRGDYIAGKGIGLVRIATPDGEIDFYNTHPLAQYQPDESDEYRAHRRTQHYELVQFINAHSSHNPAVVCGDFNMRPDQPNHEMVRIVAELEDCFATVHPDAPGTTFASTNPYHPDQPDQRIDYIFTRPGADTAFETVHAEVTLTDMPYTAKRIAYSDHAGVLVTLERRAHTGNDHTLPTAEAWEAIDAVLHTLHDGTREAQTRLDAYRRRTRYSVVALVVIGLLTRGRLRKALLVMVAAWGWVQWRIAEGHITQEISAMQGFRRRIEEKRRKIGM